MPSHRVDGPDVSLSLYDVVGQDGDQRGFIRHAGLAASAGVQQAREVAVIDMGPPLRVEDHWAYVDASAAGSAELTDDEVQKIKVFIDQHASEHEAVREMAKPGGFREVLPEMYTIFPHAKPLLEDDGRYTRTRFSCAGLVLEAYKWARIVLLDTDAVPAIDMAAIRWAYPREILLMERGKVSRDALGLDGDGPWPVVFCGYLFHALGREAGLIRREPYKPVVLDRFFP